MKNLLLLMATLPMFLTPAYAQSTKPNTDSDLFNTEAVQMMQAKKRFRNFLSAAKLSGLADLVTGHEPITIFAPNDEAFAKLPSETVEYLLANPLELRKVLLYHVALKKHSVGEINEKKQIKTYHGKVIIVDRDAEEFILNNSAIRLSTLGHPGNIVVHEINEVLIPSEELPDNSFSRVEYVNLERYLGTWYQQGAYEVKFNKDCQGTMAKYSTRNGYIRVKNTCQLVNGKEKTATALARVKDKITNSRLKVSFVPFFRLFGLFAGDYQIIHLDENYTEAIVADADRETLFILTREREIDETKYNELVQIATEKGFRPELINRTPVFNVDGPTSPDDQTDDQTGDTKDDDIIITDPIPTNDDLIIK